MQGIIRLGDKTTHGGAVLSCSTTMFFGDIGVVRKGDRVSCPEYGDTTIVEGHPNYRDRGVPVAFHSHKCENLNLPGEFKNGITTAKADELFEAK